MSTQRPFPGAPVEDVARLPLECSVDKPAARIMAAREPAGERA